MIKYLKYIVYLSCLISCFELNKPFEGDKVTMPEIKAVNSSLYINKIIGLTKKVEIELRNKIYNEILNKNILTSYKYFNKNSYILKSTVIKHTSKNKIIISLSSPKSKDIKKLELLIPNNSLNKLAIQEKISNKIAEFVEKNFHEKKLQKLIKLNRINGLENYTELKYIFLNKLKHLFSEHSISILNTNNAIDKNHYSIMIDFSIDNNTEEKIKLKVSWEIYDKNNKLIGNIKQENIFLKSLLFKIWPEISTKIIEMSLNEINILTNVHK